MKIKYEPHPVSPKRKAELRDQGYTIVDKRYEPESEKPVKTAKEKPVKTAKKKPEQYQDNVNMTLIIEDGSGILTADSFVSVEEADTYHADFGNAAWAGANASKEAALRRATAYISTGFNYHGLPANGRNQALAWPRSGIVLQDGSDLPNDAIPAEVKIATFEAALFESQTPNGLNKVVDLSQRLIRQKIDVLEFEYADLPVNAEASKPVLTKVENVLSAFISGSASSSNPTFLLRA